VTRLQPVQRVKLLKQTTHAPVTACTDRRRPELYHRTLPSLRAGWALCSLHSAGALTNAVDGWASDRQRRPCHGPLYGANDSDVHGLVFSLYQGAPWSVCNRTLPATRDAVHGGGYAVMRSEMHWTKLTGPHAGYALNRIMQLCDMRLCGVASHWNSLASIGTGV